MLNIPELSVLHNMENYRNLVYFFAFVNILSKTGIIFQVFYFTVSLQAD